MKWKSSNLILLVEIAAIVCLHIAKHNEKEKTGLAKTSVNATFPAYNDTKNASLIVWAKMK